MEVFKMCNKNNDENKSELIIFTNEEFGDVRTTIVNGEPYFVDKDVALALGYSDASSAILRK